MVVPLCPPPPHAPLRLILVVVGLCVQLRISLLVCCFHSARHLWVRRLWVRRLLCTLSGAIFGVGLDYNSLSVFWYTHVQLSV